MTNPHTHIPIEALEMAEEADNQERNNMTQEVQKIDQSEVQSSQDQSATVLQIIQQAAVNPNVDIDKMERLMQMHERSMDREAEKSFNEAMQKAQKEMPAVTKNKHNIQTNSNYSDLEAINLAITPIISANGFSTSFGTDQSTLDGHYGITCKVSHIGGHTRDYRADIPFDDTGIKGSKNKTNTHAFGSTMSYGRRYLNIMIWNVSTSDDDGNAAGNGQVIAEEQMQALTELIEETETDIQRFCKHLKIASLAQMPLAKYGNAERLLLAKKAEQNG